MQIYSTRQSYCIPRENVKEVYITVWLFVRIKSLNSFSSLYHPTDLFMVVLTSSTVWTLLGAIIVESLLFSQNLAIIFNVMLLRQIYCYAIHIGVAVCVGRPWYLIKRCFEAILTTNASKDINSSRKGIHKLNSGWPPDKILIIFQRKNLEGLGMCEDTYKS